MEYMKHFKFDLVQFDRDYVTKLNDTNTYAMLSSLVTMSKNLHFLTVAKWVDKEEQKIKLTNLGLDYMQENQEKIEDKLFKIYYKNNPPKRVFYDVTSSYVEGDYEDSELIRYGYNRDGKKSKQQIVIGLLTDENGHAISIHTYPGNTNDVKTFILTTFSKV